MLLAVLCSSLIELKAQETRVYTTEMKWYNQGLDLFEKQKYAAAYKSFEKSLTEIGNSKSEVYANSSYYKALCALNLFHKDAEYQLKEFVSNYPESQKVRNAYFQLGKYNYRKRKWEKVIYWFSKTDAFSFSNEELYEYNFRMGYAHFQLEKYDKASPYFSDLLKVESPYQVPSIYYYAHIAYLEGNYETALNGFNQLEKDKKFGVIIPYYITQIYYYQKRYDELVSYALPMLENEKTKRKPEISKLVGDAYFQRKKYTEAIPYLQFYQKEGNQPTREDYFQLAYAFMMSKDCDSAIKYFSRTSAKEDEMAQKAVYNMGKCYLELGNKAYARNAFNKASTMDYIPEISEESLLSYAKLSYELDFDPYSDAINAFVKYLEKYPNGIKKDEAFKYLVNIYLSTNNYRAAIASLEKTKNLDPRLKEVYQQLQFNLGVELYQNNNFKDAIESFSASQQQAENKQLYAQSTYWIAESYYQQKRFNRSIEEFKTFLFEPRAILLPEFKTANYSLGYAYYQNKDYNNGATWFRKFLTNSDLSPSRKHDALVRTGDCYYITKQYLLSEEYYRKAYQTGGKNSDYALYQYATTQGLLKKKSSQITSLEKLLTDYPESTYATGAIYELGKNYMVTGQDQLALQNFTKVIEDESANPYRKKALENSGLIYYNSNQNDKALQNFKQVVTEYPNYNDSKSALNQIQLIYKSSGDIDSYENYIATLSFMDISDGALDSLTYASAEDFYLDNNLAKAEELFSKYLQRFANPIFGDQANFYLAECEYSSNKFDNALVHYSYNVKTKNPLFYTNSLKRSAELSYKLNKHNEAIAFFELLKNAGLNSDEMVDLSWWRMKSASKIDSNKLVLTEGLKLTQDSLLDEQRNAEALFLMANSYKALNDTANALQYYRLVNQSTQNETSAESLYKIAKLLYENHALDSSEKVIFELAQHTPTYADWLAKGLILLSDIYVLEEDYFQARTTLESIVGNYDGDLGVLQEAKTKLQNLTDLENSEFDDPKPEEVDEVGFEEEEGLGDDLFEEEELEEEELPREEKEGQND